MAEVQQSGPLPGEKFTQSRWVQIFGAESGIVGDTDGSTFGLTLPPASDVAEVGSPTIESVAMVGGFPLIIPAGTTQSLTIPPSTNASVGRTDLICARLDTAAYTAAPGPVRLHRIAGTEGSASLPGYDAAPPSPDTLPLWSVTRKMDESLNQAVVRDLRIRADRNYDIPDGGVLPQTAPLGARATRGDTTYRRTMVGSSAQWVVEEQPPTILTYASFVNGSAFPGWIMQTEQRLVYDARTTFLWVHIVVVKNGGQIIADSQGAIPGHTDIFTLDSTWKPPVATSASGYVLSDGGQRRDAGGQIASGGQVRFTSTQPGAEIRTVVLDAFYAKP